MKAMSFNANGEATKTPMWLMNLVSQLGFEPEDELSPEESNREFTGAPYPGYPGLPQRPGTPQSTLSKLYESQRQNGGGHPGGVDSDFDKPDEPFVPWYTRLGNWWEDQQDTPAEEKPGLGEAIGSVTSGFIDRAARQSGSILDAIAGDLIGRGEEGGEVRPTGKESLSASGMGGASSSMAQSLGGTFTPYAPETSYPPYTPSITPADGMPADGMPADGMPADGMPGSITVASGPPGSPAARALGRGNAGDAVEGWWEKGFAPLPPPPFDPRRDLFEPWAESFYGAQRLDFLNEQIGGYQEWASAANSKGNLKLQMYQKIFAEQGPEAAEEYHQQTRFLNELTNEHRQEAHELGELLPDEFNQGRLNLQMADVLGVAVEDLEKMSQETVIDLFNQGYPEFAKRQAAADWMSQSRTQQYDLGLEGDMGEILTPVIGMQLDGKIEVDDNGSWEMPNYEMFDEADHLFYAAWKLRADLENSDFPKESLDEAFPEELYPGDPGYDTAGEFIITGDTVFESYFDVGPGRPNANPEFYAALESLGLTGIAQMRALSGMVANLLNKTPSTSDPTTAQTWFRVLALGRG